MTRISALLAALECFLAVLTSSLASPQAAAQSVLPAFEFVRMPATNQHVELQPQGDHYRVHFLVRAERLTDARCYARLVCTKGEKNGAPEHESEQTAYFTPTSVNDVFELNLRTPQFRAGDARYEIHVGTRSPSHLKLLGTQHDVDLAAAWIVAAGPEEEPKIVLQRENGQRLYFDVTVYVPYWNPVANSVEFRAEYRMVDMLDYQIGFCEVARPTFGADVVRRWRRP